jgi:hypothetical protein
MKFTSILAAAALFAGTGFALAQTAPAPTGPAAQGQCWDSATNTVRERTAMTTPGSTPASPGTASGQRAPGEVTTGAAPGGDQAATTGAAGAPTGTAAVRPPGMPLC